MADSRDKSGKSPPQSSWPIQQKPAAPASGRKESADAPAGRIVHDERGNAVWNWAKNAGRACIDSTSALLKKLDFGDLKVEGDKEEGLRLEDPGARDAGGGYDPYNQKVAPKKSKPLPPKK